MQDISIVCVYNNKEILENWLLKSLKKQTIEYELILLNSQDNQFQSAAVALNYGGSKATGKFIFFIHQDINLVNPQFLQKSLDYLNHLDNLGIAGIAGKSGIHGEIVTKIIQGEPPRQINVRGIVTPLEVESLDECLLIIPKEEFRKIPFDTSTCDDWHLYGVDYCLTMKERGLKVVVLPICAYHRSEGGSISRGYFHSLSKLFKKHQGHYPVIITTVGIWNAAMPVSIQRLKFLISGIWFSSYKWATWFLNFNILRFNIRKYLAGKPGLFILVNTDEKSVNIFKGTFPFEGITPRVPIGSGKKLLFPGGFAEIQAELLDDVYVSGEIIEYIWISSLFEYPDHVSDFLKRCSTLLPEGGLLFIRTRHEESVSERELCIERHDTNKEVNSADRWIDILDTEGFEILSITTDYPLDILILCRKNRNRERKNFKIHKKSALWRLISNFESDKLWKMDT